MYTSTFGNQMKIAIIIPIYINGKYEDDINNFRPIYVLPQFSQMFSRKMFYLLMEIIFYIKINIIALQSIQQYIPTYIIITF